MRKRIAGLMLAVALSVSLTACGGSKVEEKTKTGQTQNDAKQSGEEEGIEGEDFNTFIAHIWDQYDTVQNEYMAPAYDEFISGLNFEEEAAKVQDYLN